MDDIRNAIRDIPDFPKPGIIFKDITPVMLNPAIFRKAIAVFAERNLQKKIDKIAGIEARGFIFGSALAFELDRGFVPVRKKGKLPGDTVEKSYDLEYGTATIEVHADAIQPGERVLVIDDLLATGGTAEATIHLVEQLGGIVAGCDFLVELGFLDGRKRLQGYDVFAPIVY